MSRFASNFDARQFQISLHCTLWLNFNIAGDEEYRQQKVMKCHPNYATQKDKNNNQIPTLLLTYTQALIIIEPNVTRRYFRTLLWRLFK